MTCQICNGTGIAYPTLKGPDIPCICRESDTPVDGVILGQKTRFWDIATLSYIHYGHNFEKPRMWKAKDYVGTQEAKVWGSMGEVAPGCEFLTGDSKEIHWEIMFEDGSRIGMPRNHDEFHMYPATTLWDRWELTSDIVPAGSCIANYFVNVATNTIATLDEIEGWLNAAPHISKVAETHWRFRDNSGIFRIYDHEVYQFEQYDRTGNTRYA